MPYIPTPERPAGGLCSPWAHSKWLPPRVELCMRSLRHLPCLIPDCTRSHYSKGYCQLHYRRWRETGDPGEVAPRLMLGATLLERWEAKVDKNGPVPEHRPDLGPCWLWTAKLSDRGYGIMKGANRRTVRAHRVGYELHIGPIPDGLELDHLCRVRACVRPSHMEATSHKQNVLRGESVSAKQARKTECHVGHPFTGPDARVIYGPNGRRTCALCKKVSDARWRAKSRVG